MKLPGDLDDAPMAISPTLSQFGAKSVLKRETTEPATESIQTRCNFCELTVRPQIGLQQVSLQQVSLQQVGLQQATAAQLNQRSQRNSPNSTDGSTVQQQTAGRRIKLTAS